MVIEKNTPQFQRFTNFNNWFMSVGGHPLTPEQIEVTFVKFEKPTVPWII